MKKEGRKKRRKERRKEEQKKEIRKEKEEKKTEGRKKRRKEEGRKVRNEKGRKEKQKKKQEGKVGKERKKEGRKRKKEKFLVSFHGCYVTDRRDVSSCVCVQFVFCVYDVWNAVNAIFWGQRSDKDAEDACGQGTCFI